MSFASWQASAALHRAVHQFLLLTVWFCVLPLPSPSVEGRHAHVRLSTASWGHFADGPSKAKESYSVSKQLHCKNLFISLTWSAGKKVSPPSSKYWSTPSSSPSPPSAPPISAAGYSSAPRPGTKFWLGSSPGSIFNCLCWVLSSNYKSTKPLYSL